MTYFSLTLKILELVPRGAHVIRDIKNFTEQVPGQPDLVCPAVSRRSTRQPPEIPSNLNYCIILKVIYLGSTRDTLVPASPLGFMLTFAF